MNLNYAIEQDLIFLVNRIRHCWTYRSNIKDSMWLFYSKFSVILMYQ